MNNDIKALFDSSVVISEIDSTIIKYKLDSLKNYRENLQYNSKLKPNIEGFFKALDNAKNNKVRIMHYGDSQIEADRITSYIRNKLQNKFGGNGVGLFPIVQVANKMSVNTTYSENWQRFTGFGILDSTVNHNKYGALMSFCRYTNIPLSNLISDSTTHHAWVKINKPKVSYGKTKTYTQLKIFLSNNYANTHYIILADGENVKSGDISANSPFEVIKTQFNNTPNEIIINFSGKDSPDIYGISLEGNTGVVMDNIPLRGCSGTIFTKQDATLLSNMYANLSPNLIIMEFGGNTIPYINTETK